MEPVPSEGSGSRFACSQDFQAKVEGLAINNDLRFSSMLSSIPIATGSAMRPATQRWRSHDQLRHLFPPTLDWRRNDLELLRSNFFQPAIVRLHPEE
jgi:hypothetical protein